MQTMTKEIRERAIQAALFKNPQPLGTRFGVTKTSGRYNVFVVGNTERDHRGRFLIWRGEL